MWQRIGVVTFAAAMFAGICRAEEVWQALSGDAATEALSGRSLVYPNGIQQTFFFDGRTTYDSGHLETGRWRIDGAQYCSQWPPSDIWTCYGLERSADGTSVRFTAPGGEITIGKYFSD
ncbi:MAG: hypothetical protein WBA91_09280 [Paracoccaceae bacterium]